MAITRYRIVEEAVLITPVFEAEIVINGCIAGGGGEQQERSGTGRCQEAWEQMAIKTRVSR